ncbi:P-loop containing nucleoside triphosphate hydrolases superfamily protein [Arabidopsis thaliana]|jgi:ATP-dependent RNA helicase DDX31/DBP7|nr:P-loop containing nucleoside triphosphate hydrolases superfamily protein [Arabidopsis thaliana]AEC09865.2 P-loop containing nucleoside triphosphate hydrolases superfamily protein [Arabidopsis thaliana]|eukprot:NP_181602.2 P-loop containing nucleoside triphosphate hydrolases superfamily protein [Arabidopsis thaliana]
MMKRAQQSARETKQEAKDASKAKSGLFASCSFSSLGLDTKLSDQLKERMGFEAPTLVQAQAIPVILSGRDVLVNAPTGTGKTIAYLAPLIHHLQGHSPKVDRSHGTFALVIVPTRELCLQVYETLEKLLHRFHWIVPGYVMGGEKKAKEKARLRKGISILIATPGRLLDHLKNTASFVHKNLRWVIFDEADSILELGYGKEIEQIIKLLGSGQNEQGEEDDIVPKGIQKQNLLLSATLNDKVNDLAKLSLDDPVMIGLDNTKLQQNLSIESPAAPDSDAEDMVIHVNKSANPLSEDYGIPSQLVQRYLRVPCGARLVALLSVLKNLFEREASQKVVVFFSTRDAVDFHYSLLSEFQWPPNSETEEEGTKELFLKCKTFRLHGSMEQEDRRSAFGTFKTEKQAVLLSTDVAARGLDFPKVRCIIQYDCPGEATEYVHRVGRTARIGEKGEALLFLQPIEIDYLKELKKHGASLTEYPLMKVLDKFPIPGNMPRIKKVLSLESHPWVISLQRALESLTYAEPKMKSLAKNAFVSWVRGYAAHKGELKSIFVVKKLHLGHVAKSFALREQPSLVGKSHHKETMKRKRDERQKGQQGKKRKKMSGTGNRSTQKT